MKTVLLTIAMVLSSAAFAGQENVGLGAPIAYNPEAIYNALNVEEINLNPPGFAGVGYFGKSVGGLECTRKQVVYPGAPVHYACNLDTANADFEAIYNALNVETENLNPGIAGIYRVEKKTGGLSCITSQVVVPDAVPTFVCTLTSK